MNCWFCDHEAVTIGYGFAVCGGLETPVNCSEKARVLGDVALTQAQRDRMKYNLYKVDKEK